MAVPPAPRQPATPPTAAPAVSQPQPARPARARTVQAPGPIATPAPVQPQSMLAASRAGPAIRLTPPARDGSKRLYRMRDGREVELPPDLTAEEASQLEAEAIAAQSQLGKGPPPQPVPDVKKLVKKDEKKAPAKAPSARKAGGPRPRAGAKGRALIGAALKVGASKVAQYLAAKGLPVQRRGLGLVRRLAQNEQTHDDAGQKLQQSEKAVVNPPAEGQSKSNAGQVEAVSAKPAPTPNENTGKRALQTSLQANTPRKIEDVDNFKRDMKGQHIGADVMKVIQGDTKSVTATFGDVKTTPPPAPPEQTPQALPPEEIAPPTPAMHLGQGAIAPLQKDHTDVSHYTKEADGKLKEEGVTQEQLDMVDSGDLAAANKEKKGMETAARTEPLAIQQFAQQENTRVAKELGQDEKQQRESMKGRRKAGLGATSQKQKGTKSALEKKRDDVAKKINEIYTRAQNSVKKKLADLETVSMKRFDDGNAKAARDFEDNVNREIAVFKADRYSGTFGWARRARDWLKGIDDLPQVKAIFERNRTAFVNTINKLVEDISADNKKVIAGCKEELAAAKKEIKAYVDKLGPDLKDIGRKSAAEMNARLADLDGFINKKEEELQNSLKDKQTAAIKAIDEKIEKMKEAMSGALAKLGRLLLWAAKKFFTWALEKFGYSLADIQSIIDKGVAVLKAIFTKPIVFVKNLMRAAIMGFESFKENFLKHLKDALFEWLTGSLQGIQLPATWDLKGIVSVTLQMVGISKQNFRQHLVAELTEPVVAGLEKGAGLVKTLLTEGPLAAWEQLKEMAGEIRKAFEDAVKDYIKRQIVIEAVKWVVSLFVPGAGIIKAIIGIYDTIVFFIQKARQIMKMIANFLGSIGEIAAGNIGAAAKAMEEGLARGLSLVISFLAALLRLSGITNAIKAALAKIKGKVDEVLKKLAKWVAAPLKKVYAVAKAGVQKGVEKMKDWWAQRRAFRNRSGAEHTLSLEPVNGRAGLVISSNPKILERYLAQLPPAAQASPVVADIRSKITQINSLKGPDGNFGETAGGRISQIFGQIVALLQQIQDTDQPAPDPTVARWPEKQPVTVLHPARQTEVLSKKMIADPLTINPGSLRGYTPSHRGILWQSVNRRGIYFRGHLLNHHLFGPGNAENLVPMTVSLNTWFGANVESVAKRKVLDERKRVRYEVAAQFNRAPGSRINIPDESALPSGLTFSLKEYEYRDNAWVLNSRELLSPTSKSHELGNDVPLDQDAHDLNLWQSNAGSKPDNLFRKYSLYDRFVEGELVLHPTFGKGIVAVSLGDKITVTFRDPSRAAVKRVLLVHNRPRG